MIRIDALWLSVEPMDMRVGAERLLARVVQVFGEARAHHGYLEHLRPWNAEVFYAATDDPPPLLCQVIR